jgi:hypothetical protein
MTINMQKGTNDEMNIEREDKEPGFELRDDSLCDASCWPFVTVRGDYEYTLVKHDVELEDGMVAAPAPQENDGWETCPLQSSVPSPLDQAKREQFLRDERAFAATFIDDGKDYIEMGEWVSLKRKPRPKECEDCLCLYADLNKYMVYRRKVTP